jgi:hypothetical protein
MKDYSKLTDEELRVEVAKALGWKFDGRDGWTEPNGTHHQVLYPFGYVGDTPYGESKHGYQVPDDWPRDLNAVHEALLQLTKQMLFAKWYANLEKTLHAQGLDSSSGNMINATARQRCIALLMTLETK